MRKFHVMLICIVASLVGCGGKETILPQDGSTMMDIYERHAGGASQSALYDARSALRRPQNAAEEDISPFVRDQVRETQMQFRRLPNPDLAIFTFPHLATQDEAPVPGYMTLFPLYEHVHYALPGEPSEL